jgi:hypothetical protein
MLTQEFCNYLEYQVSATLYASTDPDKRGCWCDGILLPAYPEDYALQRINSTKQVITRAWMGKSGQDPYNLAIRFGKKAIRYYMRGNDLEECVPSTDNADWIALDERAKTAVVELL